MNYKKPDDIEKISVMKSKFIFNKIYVVESLPSNERKTGRDLNDDTISNVILDINNRKELGISLHSEYHAVSTKDEFDNTMKHILNETIQNNIRPVIHFEIHGSKNGLSLSDGVQFVYEINWNEIYDLLLPINIAANFNLFITLAVCHGAHLIRSWSPTQPPPFCGFIGAVQSITQRVLSEGFSLFYAQLISGISTKTAIDNLNCVAEKDGILFLTTSALNVVIYFLKKAFTIDMNNVVDGCLAKQPQHILESIKIRVGEHNIKEYVSKCVYTTETKERYIQKVLSNTFLWDQFPENKIRFNITYDEMIKIRDDFHYFYPLSYDARQ